MFFLFLLPTLLINSLYSQMIQNWIPPATYTMTPTSADAASHLKVKNGEIYVTGESYDYSNSSFAITTIKYNSSGTPLWTANYISTTSNIYNPIISSGIDVDGSGNVYVAGTEYNGNNYDYVTIKYGPNGGNPLWVAHYDNLGNDEASAIGIDNSGNIYVTGGSYDDLIPRYPNIHTTTISYDASGNVRTNWPRRYWQHEWPHGPNNGINAGVHKWYSKAFALAIANTDGTRGHAGVYVVGEVDNGIDCGGDDCKFDISVVHYNFDGTSFEGDGEDAAWYGCGDDHVPPELPAGDDWATSVAVSEVTGDVFVNGAKLCREGPPINQLYMSHQMTVARYYWKTPGTDLCPDNNTENPCTNPPCFYVDHCYCDNARYFNVDGGENIGTSVVVDANDVAYGTGYSENANGDVDYVTIKYYPWVSTSTNGGNWIWVSRYNSGSNLQDEARSIAINSSGNVFVTGISGFPQDITTIQYRNSDGFPVCTSIYNGTSGAEDRGISIGVDGGFVYVTGVTNGLPNFNNQSDFITLKYTECNGTGGDTKPFSVKTQQSIPGNYSISQNYPNPFNPTTTINYSIPKASYVSLKIYNSIGQRVLNLTSSYKEAGYYSEFIDASLWSSGIYFYTIETRDAINPENTFVDTKKMLLVK